MQNPLFTSPEEEAKFYKDVLNSIHGLITVNQIEDLDDATGNIVIWSNQKFHDYSDHTAEEIKAKGFEFFVETIHPDDMELIAASLKKIGQGNHEPYGGMLRIRSKHGDYRWFMGYMSGMEMKNDLPWRYIVMVINIENLQDSHNQIVQLIRENLQLKHQLQLQSLGKREVEIIRLIAKGNTDKQIAALLSISPATVKTHRHNIIQKLQLKNKAEIAWFASESGLI